MQIGIHWLNLYLKLKFLFRFVIQYINSLYYIERWIIEIPLNSRFANERYLCVLSRCFTALVTRTYVFVCMFLMCFLRF